MVTLRLENLHKEFSSPPAVAIKDTSLTIDHGEFFTIVGPSGCGKTTLLRMIAGLERPSSGEIYFDEEPVTDLPPQDRNVAMAFQDVALYPHMTCRENIGYGLKVRGKKEAMDEKVEEAAQLLQISDQLDKRPNQLSGGQQQRVALGRSIVRDPNLLLLDEPMSDLDAKLKADLRVAIQELHTQIDTTFIYVTHDQREALTMSTKVGLIRDGEFAQIASPDEIYDYPATEFVGRFIGQPEMNVLPAHVGRDGEIQIRGEESPNRKLRIEENTPGLDSIAGKDVNLGFRPEHIELSSDPTESLLDLEYVLHEREGENYNIYTKGRDGADVVVISDERPTYTQGESVGIRSFSKLHTFDTEDRSAILHLEPGDYRIVSQVTR